jgi:hypothetical protein
MAKRGRRFVFHGAFGSRARAEAKHKRVRGSFIRVRTIRGHRRYLVLTRRSQ